MSYHAEVARVVFLVLGASVAYACAAPPQPSNAPSPASSAPAPASASASAAASSAPRPWAPPDTQGKLPERDTVVANCKEMASALDAGKTSAARVAAIAALDAKSLHVEDARFAWCKEQLTMIAVDDEATIELDQIGKDLNAAYDHMRLVPGTTKIERTFCASARPVPDSLDKLAPTYQSSQADWSGGGWDCARYNKMEPQALQYEVVADVNAKTFVAYARRRVGAVTIEYSLSGAVKGGVVAVAPEIQQHIVAGQ
jgi:hypothetical protein